MNTAAPHRIVTVAWLVATVAAASVAGPCPVECPPDAIIAPEPCGDDQDTCARPSMSIPTDAVVCATGWASDGTRDIDLYPVVVTTRGTLTASLVADFDGLVLITGDPSLCQFPVLAVGHSTCGDSTPARITLDPGTYGAYAATDGFDGWPCGTDNDYILTLTFVESCTCPDLDGDGVVGATDLATLLGDWGTAGSGDGCSTDADGSGSVDSEDLAILLSSWGVCG
ncbi:MAG: hypothetical protein KDA25_06390 [Phycisphaerales bacterium]|nr:hypothetical protein [Phycisphaerales bacterium]